MYKKFVAEVADVIDIGVLSENEQKFSHHLYALYATNVMFQQASRPYGKMLDAKAYFSEKHKLGCCKTKTSALMECVYFYQVMQLE